MINHRMSKGETEYYTSFEELRKGWGLKPVVKQTKDADKLAKQKENFCNRHKCPSCGAPMTYIGGNQMACQNPSCKGIKHEMTNDETGEKKIWYTTAFDLLDSKGAEIGNNIFSEV